MISSMRGSFHKLYTRSKPRAVYYKGDFVDYVLMLLLSGLAITTSYGAGHAMSLVGLSLCGFMLVAFIARHGIEFRVPAIVKRPQEAFYALVYKFQNLRPVYIVAVGLLVLEN